MSIAGPPRLRPAVSTVYLLAVLSTTPPSPDLVSSLLPPTLSATFTLLWHSGYLGPVYVVGFAREFLRVYL